MVVHVPWWQQACLVPEPWAPSSENSCVPQCMGTSVLPPREGSPQEPGVALSQLPGPAVLLGTWPWWALSVSTRRGRGLTGLWGGGLAVQERGLLGRLLLLGAWQVVTLHKYVACWLLAVSRTIQVWGFSSWHGKRKHVWPAQRILLSLFRNGASPC